MMYAGCYVAS